MKGIIIDENLPASLVLPTSIKVNHALTLGLSPTDTEIWDYAKENDLIIITKDADFSHRIVAGSPPPRIVHLRIGNMKLQDLISFMKRSWTQVETHLPVAKLINVYADRIEVVVS